jgi:hypothetical protein
MLYTVRTKSCRHKWNLPAWPIPWKGGDQNMHKIEFRTDAEYINTLDLALEKLGKPSSHPRKDTGRFELRVTTAWMAAMDGAMQELGIKSRSDFIRLATLGLIKGELARKPTQAYSFTTRAALLRFAVAVWINDNIK